MISKYFRTERYYRFKRHGSVLNLKKSSLKLKCCLIRMYNRLVYREVMPNWIFYQLKLMQSLYTLEIIKDWRRISARCELMQGQWHVLLLR